MNKRVRSRIIKTLISIVIIIAVLAGAAVYFLAFSRQSGGGTLLPGAITVGILFSLGLSLFFMAPLFFPLSLLLLS